MQVPDGFSVELVAGEPALVNPVAMTFDERGRIWVTESLEYPRRSAGRGRDRIKILEDTDGDGATDRVAVFADGLNIPSGIALGYGGVWVANAPDILLLTDTDGDDRADRREVVVSGFGRSDTHELPNSLTFGPDGWLYGLNGVFNHSQVTHQGREYNFTCAMFRIHPHTRQFQLFAEGTSNPWGIAFDGEGNAFVSACVIDHLWHITETGYYHRQAGAYPPFTWKIGSIVQHAHHMAAYCGIHFFDSDAYPPEYRERLYMGNIHGNSINVDRLSRRGSTYWAEGEPDMLVANDVWFMPVVQKTGPDGCLYILDWYDRYHCYQDANRDPQGIDRGRGRLYRIRYGDAPRAEPFDLSAESDQQLIERLGSPNIFFRDMAQRILAERRDPGTAQQLERLTLDPSLPRKQRLHALWARISMGELPIEFHRQLLAADDATWRAWGVRAAGNASIVDSEIQDSVASLANDSSPDVRLQVAIAATKLAGLRADQLLTRVLIASQDDPLIPHIVWQNLHPLVADDPESWTQFVTTHVPLAHPSLSAILPRMIQRLMAEDTSTLHAVAQLIAYAVAGRHHDAQTARMCLAELRRAAMTSNRGLEASGKLQPHIEALLEPLTADPQDPLHQDAILLAATWRSETALSQTRQLARSPQLSPDLRIQALQVLVFARDPSTVTIASELLVAPTDQLPLDTQRSILAALGPLPGDDLAKMVLAAWEKLDPQLQPAAAELLTQRASWAKLLLDRIEQQQIPNTVLHINQLRRLQDSSDAQLRELVRQIWGTIRADRNPQSEATVRRMEELVREIPGDPHRGWQLFRRTCAQCHQIYGEGQQVGPDITRNGRGSFEQLLSNVFDPNLVIGSGYQGFTAVTLDGRTVTGLLVEQSDAQIVLKLQGGNTEVIPRDELDELIASPLSLMPEGWENQYTPQELADLVAFLVLDHPPSDPTAQPIPGAP